MAGRRKGNELARDYLLLERMSKELKLHEDRIRGVSRRIARKARGEFGSGIVENLDIVATYMKGARKELERAKRELKLI